MPDLIPLVTIQLDKERHLKLTLGGMKRFQEVTEKSLLKGFDFNDMSESDLIAFIWACLVWEDKKLSLEDLGYLLDFAKLQEVMGKLSEAVSVSSPLRKDDVPLVETPQTFSNSGQ